MKWGTSSAEAPKKKIERYIEPLALKVCGTECSMIIFRLLRPLSSRF